MRFPRLPRLLSLVSVLANRQSDPGRERYRRVALGAGASFAARVASLALMALSVHWASAYLGIERFGVWITLASLAGALSFLDLGIGNAIVNRVARASARSDHAATCIAVAGGFGWLVLAAMFASAVLASVAAAVPWGTLFKLSSLAVATETRTAALVFSVLFGVHMVSSGMLKVLVGQQRSHEAQMITMGATAAACLAVWYVSSERLDIAYLLLAGFGIQSIVSLFAVHVLRRRQTLKFDHIVCSMRHEAPGLLKTGALFLGLQIGTMVGWGGDSLLLASLAGAEQVAAFAVAQRLFQLTSQPIGILNGPMWAAYADAHARSDKVFLRHALLRSAWISVSFALLATATLLGVGPWLVHHWTGGTIVVPWSLLLLIAIWTILEAGGTVLSAYLNGVGVVREQLMVVAAFCMIALPLKLVVTPSLGASGLVAVTVLTYTVVVVGAYGTVLRTRILEPIRAPDVAGSKP